MTEQELAKKQKCLALSNGVEIWIDYEKAEEIQRYLDTIKETKLITLQDTPGTPTINTAFLVGIYTPEQMEDAKRRKNGQTECKWGYWHDRHKECNHGATVQPVRAPAQEPVREERPFDPKRRKAGLALLQKKKEELLGHVTPKA